MNPDAWAWSRGGFEHAKFLDSQDWDFSSYQAQECAINLWDHYDNNVIRPFYHVTDTETHKKVCNLYLDMLKLKI